MMPCSRSQLGVLDTIESNYAPLGLFGLAEQVAVFFQKSR